MFCVFKTDDLAYMTEVVENKPIGVGHTHTQASIVPGRINYLNIFLSDTNL